MKKTFQWILFLTLLFANALTVSGQSIQDKILADQKEMASQVNDAQKQAKALHPFSDDSFKSEAPVIYSARQTDEVWNAYKRFDSLEKSKGQTLNNSGFISISRMFQPYRRLEGSLQGAGEADSVCSGPNNSVILHNGEVHLASTQMDLPGRCGVSFNFTRTYRSQIDYYGPMGKGWDHNHNIRIIGNHTDIEKTTTLTLYNGSEVIHFTKNGNSWQVEPGFFMTLAQTGNGILVQTSDNIRFYFEPAQNKQAFSWRIARIESPVYGEINRLQYQYYAGTDSLKSVTDPYGNIVSFSYNTNGLLKQISFANESIRFFYDNNGCLTTCVVPNVARGNNLTSDFTEQYSYQKIGAFTVLSEIRSIGQRKSVKYDYSVANGFPQAIGAGVYTDDGKVNQWKMEYNPNVVTVIPPAPFPSEKYTFDEQNSTLLISKEIAAQKAKWLFKYNADGLITEEVQPEGQIHKIVYDSANSDVRLRCFVLQDSMHADRSHKGQLIEYGVRSRRFANTNLIESQIAYDITATGKERILNKKSNRYDSETFLTMESEDATVKTLFYYNKQGDVAVKLFADGSSEIYYYDQQFPKKVDALSFRNGEINGKGLCVRVIQDANDEEITKAEQTLNITIPKQNRLVKAVNSQQFFLWNERGNRIAEKDDLGISIVFYNRLDMPLMKYNSTGVLDLTEYNEQFAVAAVYHAFEPGKNNPYQGNRLPGFSASFYKESFVYDSFGRTIKHTPTDEFYASMGGLATWTYEHTPSGLLISITDPIGVKRMSEYNEVGRVKTIYIENKGKKCILSSDYKYSPTGKIISSKNNHNQITRFEFDSLGRAWKTYFPNGTTGVLEQNGLNQTESETVYFGGTPIKHQKTEYGLNGKPTKVINSLIYNGISKEIITSEYLYDSSARVIASRESMPDSWTTVLYDGMDNVIAAKSPSGSVNVQIYDKGLVVFNSITQINEVSNNRITTGGLTYYDARNNPWLKIPLDTEGKVAHDKATITKYDNIGNVIEQITPGLSRQTTLYNTIGKTVQKVFIPLSRNFGEKDIVTTYKYDEAGNTLQIRTDNHAFAIYGSTHQPKPDFVDAPQIRQFTYDELGRTVDEIQPDGLVIHKHYNDSSLVQTIEWISNSGRKLRSLDFSYTSDQLVSQIRNNENGKIVRRLAYDHLGRLYRSTDMSGDQTVIVERSFDSFDSVRKETVTVDGKTFPTKNIEINPSEGIESLSWNGIDLSNPWWRTLTLKSDASGRIKSFDLDGRQFCRWDYQGTQFVQRTIPDSCLVQKRIFNKLNELESISIHSPQNPYPSIELSYKYGKWGEVQTFVSKLHKSETESSVSTDYNQYDANMNLVGENSDQFIPENIDLRREQIFNSGTEVVSGRSRRSQYDQAGNVWASWRGEKTNQPWLISSYPNEVGTKFYSAASIIKSTPPTRFELQELASNRCASVASYNDDNTLQAKDYSYDEFGCLSGYDGYYNQTVPVSWKLEYDLFGRLVKMHANLRGTITDSTGNTIELDKIDIAELTFVYDAFNRRILKNSYDYSNNIAESYATLYERNHPCLILQKAGSNSWLPIEQYLWGADQQELLMAVLSPSKEEGIDRNDVQRYYLHQDRVFSVIASTKTVADVPYLASVASYLGFGENSTLATIKSISSSMEEQNTQAAYDKHLDGDNNAEWNTTGNRPYIELSLDDVHTLSNLTIYGKNQFPQKFEVYVIPVNQKSPTPDNIEKWKESAKNKGWQVSDTLLFEKACTLNNPYVVPLGKEGNRIVIAWDSSIPSRAVVREFEVGIIPDNFGSIAFSGQWLDKETGLYYQTNRYRLPELNGKFISPDPLGFADGINFYAYAHNNPLSWHDPDGQFAHVAVGAIVGGLLGGGMYAINCWLNGEEFSWAKLGVATLAGAASGALAALAAPLGPVVAGAIAGGTYGLIQGFGFALLDGASLGDALIAGVTQGAIGAVYGAIGGFVGGKILDKLQAPKSWQWLSFAGKYQPLLRGATTSVLTGAGVGATVGTINGAVSAGYESIQNNDSWQDVALNIVQGGVKGGVTGLGAGAVGGAFAFGAGAVANKVTYGKWGFTKSGQRSIWNKARKQYWKSEAASGNLEKYTEADIARMQKGFAPKASPTASYESRNTVELHHGRVYRRSGLPQSLINQKWNLQELGPREHVAIHKNLY